MDTDDTSRAMTEARSLTWDGPTMPRVSVHVATYQRREFLPELFESLESQELPAEQYEVVVVDDASGDGTWDVLRGLAQRSPMRVLALRLSRNSGPATARNLGVRSSHAPILAFTDDDCLPTAGWLSGLLDAMEPGVSVIQGRVSPPPSDWGVPGPWDHTIWVTQPSPFFQTCNVAYPRERFVAAGGFDDADPLLRPGEGRHFAEDAVLAWRVLRSGGDRGFAPDAVVLHRWLPRTFAGHIRAQRQVVGFPGLARRSPIFGRWLKGGLFLSRRSAAFDAALVSAITAALGRRPVVLAGALPWVWIATQDASRRARGDRSAALRLLPAVGATDLVTFVSLLQGSIRYRRPIL